MPISKGEFETLRVQFISLVKHPANRRPIIYKSSDGRFEMDVRLLKTDLVAKKIYGVVYEPGVVDTQGDYASAEVIEKAAHDFLTLGLVNMIDDQHSFDPGKGIVKESFILRGEDPQFPGVNKGAWCVVIQPDETMIAAIERGDITGLSLAGQGTYKKSAELTPQIKFDKSESHLRFASDKPATSPQVKFSDTYDNDSIR